MPTNFLEQRLGDFLSEYGGETTVRYVAFNEASTDSLTGDVDEDAAYSDNVVFLPALIDHSPSEAMRKKMGLEIDMDASLVIAKKHVETEGLTFKVGDKFILPPDDVSVYVTKIVPNYQSGSTFLAYVLAVTSKKGRR